MQDPVGHSDAIASSDLKCGWVNKHSHPLALSTTFTYIHLCSQGNTLFRFCSCLILGNLLFFHFSISIAYSSVVSNTNNLSENLLAYFVAAHPLLPQTICQELRVLWCLMRCKIIINRGEDCSRPSVVDDLLNGVLHVCPLLTCGQRFNDSITYSPKVEPGLCIMGISNVTAV